MGACLVGRRQAGRLAVDGEVHFSARTLRDFDHAGFSPRDLLRVRGGDILVRLNEDPHGREAVRGEIQLLDADFLEFATTAINFNRGVFGRLGDRGGNGLDARPDDNEADAPDENADEFCMPPIKGADENHGCEDADGTQKRDCHQLHAADEAGILKVLEFQPCEDHSQHTKQQDAAQGPQDIIKADGFELEAVVLGRRRRGIGVRHDNLLQVGEVEKHVHRLLHLTGDVKKQPSSII